MKRALPVALLMVLAAACSSGATDGEDESVGIDDGPTAGSGGATGDPSAGHAGAGAKAGAASTSGASGVGGAGGAAGASGSGAGGGASGAASAGGVGGTAGGTGGAASAGGAGTAGKAGSSGSGGAAGKGTAGSAGGAGGGAGGAGKAGAGGMSNGCPTITYPSGLVLQTKPNAALSAEYAKLGVSSCTVPKCFLDTLDLESPDGTKQDVHVHVATHFTLYELIRTEVDPNGTGNVDKAHAYSTSVLVDPEAVQYLEKLRLAYGGPVDITSGYRSPQHQHATCQSICGKDQCTDGSGTVTCAKNSRHMWGAAADMSLKYESAAKAAGFPFVFHENGGTAPHLHVDTQSCK